MLGLAYICPTKKEATNTAVTSCRCCLCLSQPSRSRLGQCLFGRLTMRRSGGLDLFGSFCWLVGCWLVEDMPLPRQLEESSNVCHLSNFGSKGGGTARREAGRSGSPDLMAGTLPIQGAQVGPRWEGNEFTTSWEYPLEFRPNMTDSSFLHLTPPKTPARYRWGFGNGPFVFVRRGWKRTKILQGASCS